jgi:hypothetical protein
MATAASARVTARLDSVRLTTLPGACPVGPAAQASTRPRVSMTQGMNASPRSGMKPT